MPSITSGSDTIAREGFAPSHTYSARSSGPITSWGTIHAEPDVHTIGSAATWNPIVLASGRAVASQSGGKILRLVSASRARNDPSLLQLGPDPLRPEFDPEAAAARVLAYTPSATIGEALNDQSLIAGIGNVIRIEACFLPGISPWRRIGDLTEEEARKVVDAATWVMETSMKRGSRPKQIYGRSRAPCPRCGGRIRVHGQGDDNRVTFWCEGCQR